jgi:F-type H+-transporting ATPase subunit b
MLIDWFTVIAQVVNFLILVFLLKHFLYKPVLKMIAEREKSIADRLRDAAQKEEEAQKAEQQYKQLNEGFNHERDGLLQKAQADAAAERTRLLDEGRKEADQLRARLTDSLNKDQDRLKDEFARRTGTEVFGITRRLLADMADTTLETEMVRVFIRRLQELPEDQVRLWTAALSNGTPVPAPGSGSTPAGVLVRTAFDLSAEDQHTLGDAWARKFATDRSLSFERRPDLVSGIELTVDGYKLSWDISDYLASLEKNVTHGHTDAAGQ